MQGPCGVLREEPVGFLRIQSIKGRPLYHNLYIGGAAITQLWASLVNSTPCVGQNAHPLPGTCMWWEFAVLQVNDVWQPLTWGLELGGSWLRWYWTGEPTKPIRSAHA